MTTQETRRRLCELCGAGEHRRAIEELYSDDHVAVEAVAMPGAEGRETRGKPRLLEMSERFYETHDVHGGSVDGPYPHDDAFICFMSIDVTPTGGPTAGQRMTMKEACRYVVDNGRIVRSEFYYEA